MEQLVIDIHEAARLTEPVDAGIAVRLRLIAHEVHSQGVELRRLLVSDADSQFGNLGD